MQHSTKQLQNYSKKTPGPGSASVWSYALVSVLIVGCSAKVVEQDVPLQTAREDSIEEREQGSRSGENDTVAVLVEPNRSTAAISPVVVRQATPETRELSSLTDATGNSVQLGEYSTTPRAGHKYLAQEQALLHLGPQVNRENYLDVDENLIKQVSQSPVSTFSIDVDTAAYSNLRRMLMREGRLPPRDAVRLEEMINYFSYSYQMPDSLEQPLTINTELMASPWNGNNQLLMVGIQGYEPPAEHRPNANLVFLVDVSGSMQSADKLGLVKQSLKLLVDQMHEEDRIALVVYAGAAGMVLDSTSAANKRKIRHAIDSLAAGGSTNGAAGIELAYQIAENNLIEDGINRVIIASDGDLNVGMTGIDDLKELVSHKRKNGVALTTLGFGTGNYNYSLMEQLADVGNGNASYIDSLNEARKVLIEEMQSTLLTIAKDVKIQIEFNPAVVSEYRLLGYENRLLNREDFLNDKVDAGEVGAGHTVTALYEITLADSRGRVPPTRYQHAAEQEAATHGNELAYVKVRYKQPDQNSSVELGSAILSQGADGNFAEASDNIRFAAAVAGFGQLLQGGKYTEQWDYQQLLDLARSSRGADPQGYRSEMLNMIEVARLL